MYHFFNEENKSLDSSVKPRYVVSKYIYYLGIQIDRSEDLRNKHI